jgi:formate--tetrahydrofolate ligase
MHGGVAAEELTAPNPAAVTKGLENLAAHLESAQSSGRPVTVAINRFPTDTEEELGLVHAFCAKSGAACATAEVFAKGGDGALDLAKTVLATMPQAAPALTLTYPDNLPVKEKMVAIATRFYGADGVDLTPEAEAKLALFEKAGFGRLPLCMAKTQNSLTDDPDKFGRPQGFRITVRDFELSNGAGFIVALTGAMMRMPALPKVPSAEKIDVNDAGEITGIASA